MSIGTIVFGILSLTGLIVVGQLLLRGLLSGRVVAFHYMGHVVEWHKNRIGYTLIILYNLFWFMLSAALFTATVLGRFD